MNQIEKILNVARKEIGTTEQPPNSNKVIFNTWYYGREVQGAAYSWCATFCLYLIEQADLWTETWGNKRAAQTAYAEGCPNWVKMAQATGRWVNANSLQPGDFVLFDFSKDGVAEHIGIVEIADDGKIITIEGNTSSGDSGSQSNGGGVFRRTRHAKDILGGYRPNYKNEIEEEEMRFNYLDDNFPAWAKPTIQKLMDKGIIAGNENGELNLSMDMITIYVSLDRTGIFGD